MMKVFKKHLVILALAGLVFGLAGCGEGGVGALSTRKPPSLEWTKQQ